MYIYILEVTTELFIGRRWFGCRRIYAQNVEKDCGFSSLWDFVLFILQG